jgi:hypothetical protein
MRLFWLALLGAAILEAAAADYFVRVESGDQPLENAIVAVPFTDRAIRESVRTSGWLRGNSGETLPFQQTPLGEILFVIPKIAPRTSQQYKILEGPGLSNEVRAILADGKISVIDQGRNVFTYQGKEGPLPRADIKPIFKRGGYIHPIFSPSGRLITDDYPPNHVHHHGIWFPWTKAEFEGRAVDFWNMGEGKGKVEFVEFGRNWSGPVHAGFQAEHRFVDLTSGQAKAALDETWTTIVYDVKGANYFVFDLISTQRCATASPLKLPKYYYGGLGFRGNWGWNGAKKTEILTSNGETNRVRANETRADWCHIGGEVDGQFAGVTIMSHPENFRAPQPMRVHPTEPFFCFAPSQLGDWQIEPGVPYVSRYRFVVSDGRPEREKIERLWRAYAHPPKAAIEKR